MPVLNSDLVIRTMNRVDLGQLGLRNKGIRSASS